MLSISFFKKCTCTQFDSQNVISYQKNLWIGFGFIKFITHSDMLIARKMKPIVRSGNRTQANKWNGFCIQSIRKMNSNCNSFACHIQFRRMQSNKTDTLQHNKFETKQFMNMRLKQNTDILKKNRAVSHLDWKFQYRRKCVPKKCSCESVFSVQLFQYEIRHFEDSQIASPFSEAMLSSYIYACMLSPFLICEAIKYLYVLRFFYPHSWLCLFHIY